MRPATPFVNRQEELEFLAFAQRRAQAGQGQLIAVVGEAGVGKSRLLAEVARLCRSEGWVALKSETAPSGELTSYLPVVPLLRACFGIDERDEPGRAAEEVEAAVLALDEALRPALAPLLSVLDLPVADPGWPRLDPSLRRQQVRGAVTEVLLRAGRGKPTLVVFENLQWIDPESQACLDVLVERMVRAPMLLLVSHRPEYSPPWGGTSYFNPLRLAPLSDEASAELLAALLGSDPRLHPVIRVLIEHTRGNPLFLEECVRALIESGVLSDGPASGESAAPLTEIQGLATVQAVLASRARRLAPGDQRLLEMAAVIGTRVSVPVLGAMAGLGEDALSAGLQRLRAAEFVFESGPFPGVEVTFTQPVMQEVVYGALPPSSRQALHAEALMALEGVGGSTLGARPDVLGEHALRGAVWDKAVVYSRQAGARAASRATNEEAVARFGHALAALAKLPEDNPAIEQAIDIRLDLRPPLLQLGRLADVLDVSRQAEALAQRIGDEPRLARVYTYLANYHYLKGEPEAAVRYGERCVAIGDARGDVSLAALARAYIGYCYHAQGRYADARSALSINLEELARLSRAEVSMQTAVSHVGSAAWLAFTLADLGEFDAAADAARTAQQVAEESRNPYSQAIAATFAGQVWLVRGHLERAQPVLESSLAACRDNHLVVWQPVPSVLLGLTLARAGQPSRALPLLEEGVALTERLGVKAYLARWTLHLAEGLQSAGQLDRAREAAEAGLRLGIAHQERGHQAEALRLLGEIVAQSSAAGHAQGERHIHHALTLAEGLGMRPLAARCQLGLSTLASARGDHEQSRAMLAAARDLCRAMDLRLTTSPHADP